MSASLIVTPIIVATLTPLFIWLSLQVVKQRRANRVAVGDGGKLSLMRAIGAHNNFAQYVPFALISFVLLELNHAPQWMLMALGVWLVMARGVHAYGISQTEENFRFRRFGVIGTFSILAISSFANIYYALLPVVN